jgi:hypothetical protein
VQIALLQQETTMRNYIVTTVQYNAVVNKTLLKNMLAFADQHNVEEIHVFVMPGRHKDETQLSTTITDNPRLTLLSLGKDGMKLNENIKLYDTGILASQINPLTGFNKKLHRDFSYILPSPKIRYQSIPNTSKYARFLCTTGSLTHGNYKLHTAQGRKAELEHEYGFAFVEVVNTRLFNYHPVMAMKNGNFNYNREYYHDGVKSDQQPEALVLGDWHTGPDNCPVVRKITIKMIEDLRPKRVVFHDFFNGSSINHHERGNNLSKARLWRKNMVALYDEIALCRNELMFFCNRFPDIEFFVVESNHDLFLNRYISEENFLQEGQNSVFACKLFVAVNTGLQKPMLKTAMEIIGDLPKNVLFLNEDEEYRVRGVGLHAHGHRGANGARGSGASFDRYNLKLISGHEHSPKIYQNGMVVGTSTHLRLSYTHGPGGWLNAHGILYRSGKYSLITIIR